MKVGYMYDFQAYPPKGGNHTHAYEINRNILEHGHDICVVDDPTMPGVKNIYSSDNLWIDELECLTDVLCVRVDSRHMRRWDAFKQVINSDYSKPIFLEINSPSYESLAFSWLGGKNIWDAEASENLLRYLRRWMHAKKQAPIIALEERFRRKIARRVQGAVCISSAIEKYAHNLGISNTLVLPNGGPLVSKEKIESIRASVDKNEELFNIFYSGSAIYPWQGLDILAQVIEIARTEEPNFHFTLAVNQKVDGLPEDSNVTILEALPREKVFRQILNSNVCIALQHEWWWSPIGFYGSPTKLFEYMALAGTVLVSDHGQMQDVISDGVNGYLTKNDPLAVFDKLKYIRNSQEVKRMVGWRAWQDVQNHYNWAYVAGKTVEFFESGRGQ